MKIGLLVVTNPLWVLADLMAGIMFPNWNVIFDVTSDAPRTSEEWLAVQTSAAGLAEAGNLLLLPGRKKETGRLVPVERAEWRKHVQMLVEARKNAYKAAQTKNADAVFVACVLLVLRRLRLRQQKSIDSYE